MIYETSSAASPHDLISKLHDFLSANGWNIDVFEDLGAADADTNRGFRLAVNNGEYHFGFRSFINSDPTRENSTTAFSGISGLAVIGFDSFQSSRELDSQIGKGSDLAFMQLRDAAVNSYHFFTDLADGFIAVVGEFEAGKYSSVMTGQTTKGRQFYTATSDRSGKNIDANTRPPFSFQNFTNHVRRVNNSWPTSSTQMINSTGGVNHFLSGFGVPSFSSRAGDRSTLNKSGFTEFDGNGLAHCYQFEEDLRDTNSAIYRLVGSIPNFYMVSMRNLEPAQVVSLSNEQYLVFPVLEKTDPYTNRNKQGGLGYLIRKQ